MYIAMQNLLHFIRVQMSGFISDKLLRCERFFAHLSLLCTKKNGFWTDRFDCTIAESSPPPPPNKMNEQRVQ